MERQDQEELPELKQWDLKVKEQGKSLQDRLRTKERRQGGECNPRGKGAGIGTGGSTGVRTRSGTGTGISQPNIRTNTGVRSF